MTNRDLPGRRKLSRDLVIADQKLFLQQVPELITQLRMRKPSLAFALNLSETSLSALDRELTQIIAALPGSYGQIAETIEPDLLRQVAAYVGEVMVRNRNGRWQISPGGNGPLVHFQVQPSTAHGPGRTKVIDIYEHVLATILEGGSLTNWYSVEVLDKRPT